MLVQPLENLPKARLGEGPLWDPSTRSIYWVDIDDRKIHRYSTNTSIHSTLPTPTSVGFAVLDQQGSVIAGLRDGIYRLNFGSTQRELLARPDYVDPQNRFNDGKCDPFGRLFAGTMNLKPSEDTSPTGSFYRLDKDGLKEIAARVHISNGMGWSPDNKTMYYIDTLAHRIDRFDYDPATGAATNRRPFINVPRDQGNPDGMTVDSKGNLYVALWGGSRVNVYTPKGHIDNVITLPALQPSSVAFGGPELKTLYITTASADMTPEQLRASPRSGQLFAVPNMPVAGRPETPFNNAPFAKHAA